MTSAPPPDPTPSPGATPRAAPPAPPRPAPTPTVLTVVYDETCELCRRCRHWLSVQDLLVPMEFLAAGSPAAKERYEHLDWYRVELMVIDAEGHAWVGPAAFIMCLWATRRYRATAHRFRSPTLAPMVESFFHGLSSNRSLMSGMLKEHRCDGAQCEPAQ